MKFSLFFLSSTTFFLKLLKEKDILCWIKGRCSYCPRVLPVCMHYCEREHPLRGMELQTRNLILLNTEGIMPLVHSMISATFPKNTQQTTNTSLPIKHLPINAFLSCYISQHSYHPYPSPPLGSEISPTASSSTSQQVLFQKKVQGEAESNFCPCLIAEVWNLWVSHSLIVYWLNILTRPNWTLVHRLW